MVSTVCWYLWATKGKCRKPWKNWQIRIMPKEDGELRIEITGNGFLHNMVRIIVGTLIEVGRGEREPDSIPGLFGGKRAEAGFLAPAQGLCLQEVYY